MEGGFGGGVCGPVVGDDRNLGLDVWCGGRAGGRGTGVEEDLVRVWLGGEGRGVVCGCFGLGRVVVWLGAVRLRLS